MISSGLGESALIVGEDGPVRLSVIRVFFVWSVDLGREIKRVRTRSLQRELLLSRFGVGENVYVYAALRYCLSFACSFLQNKFLLVPVA